MATDNDVLDAIDHAAQLHGRWFGGRGRRVHLLGMWDHVAHVSNYEVRINYHLPSKAQGRLTDKHVSDIGLSESSWKHSGVDTSDEDSCWPGIVSDLNWKT